MTKLNLDERFDVVVIHDAIMYLTDHDDRIAALQSAARHLNPDGLLLIRPDVVSDTFDESLMCGGGETEKMTVALTEWRYDTDPQDKRFSVAFSVMVRRDGVVNGFVESHQMALLSDREWRNLIEKAGFRCIPFGLVELDGPIYLAKAATNRQ